MSFADRSSDLGHARIAIIGAGLIGLSCAWRLARRGASVTIYDAGQAGRGASWAAAGMLAPAFEAAGEDSAHPALFSLCMKSASLWPAFARALETDSASEIGFHAGPSLALARTPSEQNLLERISARLAAESVDYETVSPDAVRQRESAVTGQVSEALLLPTDGQVDNRRVVSALVAACQASPHFQLKEYHRQVSAQNVLESHDHVIVTAGWQSGTLLHVHVPLQPIGGQLLSVARRRDMPAMTLRSGSLYIAPKHDRVVIGATVEPGEVRTGTDPADIRQMQVAAAALCSSLADVPILEAWSGVRPGTPDGAPIIQQVAPSVIAAAGHYRNGVLLAPITAQIVEEMISGGSPSEFAAAFTAHRFQPAPVSAL
ncbi:MAG: glycine oxidase ThiO [Pseudomonadota bacterium]